MAVRKYGNIYFNRELKKWIITKAEPHVLIKLKAIFSGLHKYKSSNFEFHDTPENCHDLLWFIQRYPLDISVNDQLKLKRSKKIHIDTINQLESILTPDYKPVDSKLKNGYKGRDYQLRAKDLYLKCKRIIIGDDIGLGKTIIAILAFLHKETLPALAVVETHMPKQWKDMIEKFTDLKVHLMKGTKPYSLPSADVYITKYSCLSGWSDFFGTRFFKSVVFDEIQNLRHNGTNKYDSAKELSGNVDWCLGLSASPIYNYGIEMYNIMHVVKENALGAPDEFYREWIGGYNDKTVKDPKALGTYLRENFLFLRRTREEVGRELPMINKIVHTVGYDEKEVKKVEEIAKMLAIKVMTGSFVERGQAGRDLDIRLRQNTGVAKAVEVANFVKILLENNEPVLLAGWHRDVYDIWLKELADYNPMLYTGTESPAQKEKTKLAFINGETNLMIISLRSGVGLDGLQKRCKTVVIGELDYSPKIHDQIIGRIDRDRGDNQEQVTAIFLVSDCGSDPVVVDLLGLKSSQSHNIIDPLKAVPDQYSDESRIKILAQKYLDKKQMCQ